MRKTLLFSLAAVALAGCDFSGGTDAVAPVASIQATNLPAATGSADLFFEIQDAGGRAYYQSQVQQGASTDSVAISLPDGIPVPSASSRLYVAVYDYGTTTIDSRLLARSTGFTAADLTAAPLTLQDEPFLTAGPSDATFTVTRSASAQ